MKLLFWYQYKAVKKLQKPTGMANLNLQMEIDNKIQQNNGAVEISQTDPWGLLASQLSFVGSSRP